MRVLRFCSVAGMALFMSSTAFSEPTAGTPGAPVTPVAAEENPVICKRISDTGSRVRKTKVCHTKSEWTGGEKSAQDTLRTIQHKGVQPGGDSLQAKPESPGTR